MILKPILRGFATHESVSKKQMELFNSLTGWWHPSGPSQILYLYNCHRIQFLRKFISPKNHRLPLQGMSVLDVGCGAGFLSESLARLGGNVIGLDPNVTSYNEAVSHRAQKQDLKSLQYVNSSLEQFLGNSAGQGEKKYDLVTSMEVIQHVNMPQKFLDSLWSCTKEGGLVMLSTIRRTPYSWLTHIAMAEKVLGIVPSGTHHHSQFINPEQCSAMMTKSGFQPLETLELQLNWKGEFQEKKRGSNYLIIGRSPIKLAADKQKPDKMCQA